MGRRTGSEAIYLVVLLFSFVHTEVSRYNLMLQALISSFTMDYLQAFDFS